MFRHSTAVGKKVAEALALVDDIVTDEILPLKPLPTAKAPKRYDGKPVCIRFDGGFGVDNVGVIGYQIAGTNGAVLCTRGEFKVGDTSYHAECLAALRSLETVVANSWANLGDYLLV